MSRRPGESHVPPSRVLLHLRYLFGKSSQTPFTVYYLEVAAVSKTYTNISSIRQQIVLYSCSGQGTQTYYAQAVATFTGDGNSATIAMQSPLVDVTCN